MSLCGVLGACPQYPFSPPSSSDTSVRVRGTESTRQSSNLCDGVVLCFHPMVSFRVNENAKAERKAREERAAQEARERRRIEEARAREAAALAQKERERIKQAGGWPRRRRSRRRRRRAWQGLSFGRTCLLLFYVTQVGHFGPSQDLQRIGKT